MESMIQEVTDAVNKLAGSRNCAQKPIIIAIDGRCGSGKTTLAAGLKEKNGWRVFPMDDFFLRPEQRTEERFVKPGGNVDHERFLEEILLPLQNGVQTFFYRPFDCQRQDFAEAVSVTAGDVNVVEGSYSCHPALWDAYDLRVFLDVTEAEQERRILLRNGKDSAKMFKERWIPLEERYFEAYRIKERCELCFRTDDGAQA